MKRGEPMKRTQPAPRSPATPPARARGKKTPRRNDGPWRKLVMAAYGQWCHALGAGACEGPVQAAHLQAKGQQGPNHVCNGLPLCRGHHAAYDGYRLQLRVEWLTDDQVAWLAAAGYVRWDEAGQPAGPGWRRFAPMTPGQQARANERKSA